MIAYASRLLKVHEKNYPTHDLELEVVVFALMLWRRYLYGVHLNVCTNHKSLQYVFTKTELNLLHRRWLEILKDNHMSVDYHPVKANVVGYVFSRLRMGSKSHVDDEKKQLAKDVHQLARFGVQLIDTPKRCVLVHPSSKSSFIVDVKAQHLHPLLM